MQCSNCGKIFKTILRLRQHENRKTPCRPPTHHCSKCAKGFAGYHSLWQHKQRCEEKTVDQASQDLPGFIGQKQSSMDTIPTVDGGSEFGTGKPKSNATLDRVEVAPASNCTATQVNQEDISEELAKKETDTAVQGEEIPHKTRKVRKVMDFIGEKEFNRSACQQPMPWSNLPRNCIYKLEWVNSTDAGVAGNLTNADGITVSVLLPKFVVDKILAITDTDVKIYLRPKGEDLVDIATQKKHICKNCRKEVICRKFLERHEERCTKVLRRDRNKNKTMLCK